MPSLAFPLVLVATLAASFADVTRPPQPLFPVRVASPPVFAVPLGDLAQRAAREALRTSGISESDAEVDGLATRARLSSLLPELHVRLIESDAGLKDYTSDTSATTTTYGPGFSIMGTLSFHLDKIAYSGHEAQLERLRIERIDTRARITQRVIDEVARWSRALAEEHDAPEGSPSYLDAVVRRSNAQMALDVWTAGWFSAFLAGKSP